MENLEENTPSKQERPVMLTVLCILTFAWAGISIFSGLIGIIGNSQEKQQQAIEKMRETNPELAETMEAVYLESQSSFWGKYSNHFSLIFNIGSLIGAIFMWNLKKSGFHIYTLSELLPYPFIFASGKSAMNALSGLFGNIGPESMMTAIVILIIFDALFIVLYGIHLKHMK
ncbi:MAG: hypothetical protein N3F09_11005 [Bacteroidia bacterium]|nr:hypothetical protein [Bacteroidia bacterium]